MALLLMLMLELVLLVRVRQRRRRAAASGEGEGAGLPSDDVAIVLRGPTVRRAVTPPLFAERGTGPDPMTARLRAATDPLEVIAVLRSADAADASAAPVPGPAFVPAPAPALTPAPRLSVPSPPIQAGVRGRSVDASLVAMLIAGGVAVLLVARGRGRRSGGG